MKAYKRDYIIIHNKTRKHEKKETKVFFFEDGFNQNIAEEEVLKEKGIDKTILDTTVYFPQGQSE